MLVKILKDFWSKIKLEWAKFFLVNLAFWLAYMLFFLAFSLFRFSEIFANILKLGYFFILNFLTIPILVFFSEENKLPQNVKGFFIGIKNTAKSALIFACFKVALFAGGIVLLRLMVLKDNEVLATIVFFIFSLIVLGFSFVVAEISFQFDKKPSFVLACKKSIFLFLENPFIIVLLFCIQIVFRLIAIFSLFVLPTWIFGDFIFLIAKKFFNFVKKIKI